MSTKKTKYDTNPLDPDVAKRTEESWGEEDSDSTTQEVKGATREIRPDRSEGNARNNLYSEAPTRRYDNPPIDAPYPSVFVPPTYAPPTVYQAPANPYRPAPNQRPSERPVAGIGVPEKWALMLAYAPYIGTVVCLLELFLVPRREVKVRFHASQAFALHLAFIVIQALFGVIGMITNSSFGGALFKLASFVFLVISMIRVWKGESHYIAPLAEPAQWFNEKIELRK